MTPIVTPGQLADRLRALHRHGFWITAWYPLSDGTFECRLGGAGADAWGVDHEPLKALAAAMEKAGVR